MKTLIIITWMSHVPLATHELPRDSEQHCQESKVYFEQIFKQTEGLGSILYCKERKNEQTLG